MSAYRTPEIRPPRRATKLALSRPWVLIGALAFAVFVITSFVMFGSGGVELSCSRSSGTCLVVERFGPFVTNRQTLPIASIERAEVYETRDHEGDLVHARALVHDGKSEVYGGSSNVNRSAKEAWARHMNTFLADPSMPSYASSDTAPWLFYTWAVLVLALFAFLLSLRTTVEIDPNRGAVSVRRRMFSAVQRFAVDDVECAELVTTSGSTGAVLTAAALMLRNGERIKLTLDSNTESGAKATFVRRFNLALAEAKSAP